jgi:hypothetical protein
MVLISRRGSLVRSGEVLSVDEAKIAFEARRADMHAVHVMCEDGQLRLINLETVGMVERHSHADASQDSHEHAKPVVGLKLITGEYLVVLDDGGWGL